MLGKSRVGKVGKKKSTPTRVPRDLQQYAAIPSEPSSDIQVDVVANGEQYTDYGINPFIQTSDDALSTFSIDVDTASYTIARRKLNEGGLPNYASVRAEEFINFFDYDYDSTGLTQANPFHVEMDMMEHPFKEDKEILRVGLQGMEYTVDTRPPLHLTFLVDVSGSMTSRDKVSRWQKNPCTCWSIPCVKMTQLPLLRMPGTSPRFWTLLLETTKRPSMQPSID